MIVKIEHTQYFYMACDFNKEVIRYCYKDGATGAIKANTEDKRHGECIGLTGIAHKLIHEITHHYIATALGSKYCPIAYAQAHNFPMPENATYLEELVFPMVYFIRKAQMQYADWWEKLGRLHTKVNPHVLARVIEDKFNLAIAGNDIYL